MSTWLMHLLLIEYVVIALVCLAEGKWVMGMYWGAAFLLNWSVILLAK